MGLASAWAPLPGGPLPPPFSTAALPLGGFPPLVRFPLCRAKISQVSWLGDEDNPPNGVSLSVSSSVELCCDQKKRKSGKPEEASEEQHPGPSSAGTRLPACSGSTNYRQGSARGVPGEGTAIWGCLPPTVLTSHPHSMPGRQAVSHEPPLPATQGWAAGPHRTSRRGQEGAD